MQQMSVDQQEEEAFGLNGLAQLPLLEQVHRLFHAIQKKYPYKDTKAWKTLPIDQKKKLLQYIQKRKSGLTTTPSASPNTTKANGTAKAKDHVIVQAKKDPYLQMLQKRKRPPPSSSTQQVATTAEHDNPEMASAKYAFPTRKSPRTTRKRWKVADDEFLRVKCACGQFHDEADSKAKSPVSHEPTVHSIAKVMMTTFGDCATPCVDAVNKVTSIVAEFLRHRMVKDATDDEEEEEDVLSAHLGLRRLISIFAEEADLYRRWREFKSETKAEENELDDVEEEELAEELDIFAVSEEEARLSERIMERIRFADERTKQMDWSRYDTFARGRKANFTVNKGALLCEWLGLGKCSRASLEFLNFVAYHNIGLLVELAIKKRTDGELKGMDSPLLSQDIECVQQEFESVGESASHDTTTSQPATATLAEASSSNAPVTLAKPEPGPEPEASTPTKAPASSNSTPQPERLRRLKRMRKL